MRIVLVLVFLLLVNLPSSAQSKKAIALMDAAKELVIQKDYEAAAEKFEKAAYYFQLRKNNLARSEALLQAGQSLLLAQENYKAEQVALKILDLNSSKSSMEANAYHLLGNIFFQKGNFPEALKNFKWEKYIRTIQHEPDQTAIAEVTRMIGATHNRAGRTEIALKTAKEALELFQDLFQSSQEDMAATLGTIGEIYIKKKQYDKAISYFEQAIDMFKETTGEQQELVAEQFLNIGNAYIQNGSYEIGLMNTQRGLSIIENIYGEEHPARAPYLNNIGKIFTIRKDYESAVSFYYDALDLTEFHYGRKHPQVPISYNNMADVLMAQKKYDEALKNYNKALTLNRELYGSSHPLVARNLDHIALAYVQKGNNIKALEFHNKALNLFQRKYGKHHADIAKIQQEIGQIFLKENKPYQALVYFQYALNANVPDFAAVEAMSEIPSLEDVFDSNIFLSSLALKAQTSTKLFFLEKKADHLDLAHHAYFICDSLIDGIRRSHIDHQDQLIFNNTVAEIYMDAVQNSFLIYKVKSNLNFLDDAYYFSEKSKSSVLLQSFVHDEALRFADLPDSLEVKENNLKINISFFKKQWLDALQNKDSIAIEESQRNLLEANGAYRSFVIELENTYLEYKNRKNNNVVKSLEVLQNVLPQQTGLIDFVIGKEKIFIFAITYNNVFTESINITPELNQSIFDLRKSVSDIQYFLHQDSSQHAWNTYTNSAFKIYDTFLKNILFDFQDENIQNLIIIPDGELGYLPFEILINELPKFSEIDHRKLSYLINDYTISYDYSGSLFFKHTQQQPLPEEIKYGGYAPTYGSGQLSLVNNLADQFINRGKYLDLPASRDAIEQITEILNGESFIGEEASAENFRNQQYRFDILHLAMHGIYDTDQPLNSHLVGSRSPDEKENELITASEIYNMKIQSLLVILGSCNSGYGALDHGEGVLSISRAFAYAGCPSIVNGLWSLPDEETAALSIQFIQQLKNGHPKDEALRQAKLAYLNSSDSNIPKERFHPFFWSGFVPVGDMSPIYPISFWDEYGMMVGFGSFFFLSALLALLLWKRNKIT